MAALLTVLTTGSVRKAIRIGRTAMSDVCIATSIALWAAFVSAALRSLIAADVRLAAVRRRWTACGSVAASIRFGTELSCRCIAAREVGFRCTNGTAGLSECRRTALITTKRCSAAANKKNVLMCSSHVLFPVHCTCPLINTSFQRTNENTYTGLKKIHLRLWIAAERIKFHARPVIATYAVMVTAATVAHVEALVHWTRNFSSIQTACIVWLLHKRWTGRTSLLIQKYETKISLIYTFFNEEIKSKTRAIRARKSCPAQISIVYFSKDCVLPSVDNDDRSITIPFQTPFENRALLQRYLSNAAKSSCDRIRGKIKHLPYRTSSTFAIMSYR